MKTVSKIQFSCDSVFDDFSEVAYEKFYKDGASIPAEKLEEAKAFAKTLCEKYNVTATVITYEARESGRFNAKKIVNEYEI
ncbi:MULTISPECIES: hypothetical protein [Acinetobacter]|uniref:hypothetical protein n=1 Tax=Acinetobacter TaxID=469 RepID=UPI00125FA6B0|nr:hypothetical protein [Acinetobacter guerrae]